MGTSSRTLAALLAVDVAWSLVWFASMLWMQIDSYALLYRDTLLYMLRHQTTTVGLVKLQFTPPSAMARGRPLALVLFCLGVMADIYNVLEVSLHTSRTAGPAAWIMLMCLSSVALSVTVFAIAWLFGDVCLGTSSADDGGGRRDNRDTPLLQKYKGTFW